MHQYIWQHKNWTEFVWEEKSLLSILGKVRLKQGELITKIKMLGVEDSVKAQAQVLVEETIKTAQIEGEKYDVQAVRSSVNRRLGLSQAGLPDSKRHIDGLVEVLLDATTSYDKKLSNDRLKAWQASLFPTGYSGLSKIIAGDFRDDAYGPMQVVSGTHGKEKIHFQAPPAKKIVSEMNCFLSWWDESKGQVDGVIRAGIAHLYFVTIHPFEDGNGRIARVITDMALAQDDKLSSRYYSLSKQIVKSKKEYYQILEKTQKRNSDITEWLFWFINCFNKSLQASDELLENIFAKDNFWRKYQQIDMNTRQRKVINKLLDVGKKSFKGGLTTRKYVSMTKSNRAVAYRDITDLLQKKILKLNDGKGRNVSYDVRW